MTLLARLGPDLADALAHVLVACPTHGPTPWVATCRCVLEGALAGEASPAGVRCDAHLNYEAEGDPRADEDLQEVCLQCLIDRGILTSPSEHHR